MMDERHKDDGLPGIDTPAPAEQGEMPTDDDIGHAILNDAMRDDGYQSLRRLFAPRPKPEAKDARELCQHMAEDEDQLIREFYKDRPEISAEMTQAFHNTKLRNRAEMIERYVQARLASARAQGEESIKDEIEREWMLKGWDNHHNAATCPHCNHGLKETWASLEAKAKQGEEMRAAATKALRKLKAYVGICSGDKELVQSIIPSLEEALSTPAEGTTREGECGENL
jgi:hypothetical protein